MRELRQIINCIAQDCKYCICASLCVLKTSSWAVPVWKRFVLIFYQGMHISSVWCLGGRDLSY